MHNYIKSPLNYTGGKHKLLKQIIPHFPKKIDTFVDLFTGGCNVAVNVDAKRIVANDIESRIIELYDYMKKTKIEQIEEEIKDIIREFGLSDSSKNGYDYYRTDALKGLASHNKEGYLHQRDAYNRHPSSIRFYVLLIFAFNNQIRFNKRDEFNMPVGKRDFTFTMQRNLRAFVEKMQSSKIEFYTKNFNEIEVQNNSFVYVDPPYLITLASYNSFWDAKKELELLDYLDALHLRGIKFALSNVLRCKGTKNKILDTWIASKDYKVLHLNHSYKNSSYQQKHKNSDLTREVLITNYDVEV